jgi:hypothetical protein
MSGYIKGDEAPWWLAVIGHSLGLVAASLSLFTMYWVTKTLYLKSGWPFWTLFVVFLPLGGLSASIVFGVFELLVVKPVATVLEKKLSQKE